LRLIGLAARYRIMHRRTFLSNTLH